MMHGVAVNSGIFVLKGKKSLALMLVEEGYDVWLGNFRGCRYSNNHVTLSNQDLKYWNFSFHDLGMYDVRTKLSFINGITKQKVIYIGYSLGVIAGYVYGCTYPEEAELHIDLNIGIAGSVSFNNIPLFRMLHYMVAISKPILQYLSNGHMYIHPPIPLVLYKYLCFPYPIQMYICQIMDMVAMGMNYEENDPETLPVMLQYNNDAVSVHMGVHLLQLTGGDHCYYYNYGEKENFRLYGNITPPTYDFSKIRFDCLIFHAENDKLVTPDNVKIMFNMLPNKTYYKGLYKITNKNYNHIDIINGKNADHYVYAPVVRAIREYQNKDIKV